MSALSPRLKQHILAPFFVPLLCALFLLTSPPALHASAASVKRFSPNGVVEGPVEVVVLFGTEMVQSDEVGRQLMPNEMPISLTPPLAGNGKWVDRLTFLYQPSAGYAEEATEYRATLREGLKDVSGADVAGTREYRFHTPPLRLLAVRQIDFDAQNDYVDYELRFSSAVDSARLHGYTEIRGRGEALVPHAYLGTMGTAVTNAPRLRVRADDGSPVVLAIEAGLPPARGNLGLEERASLALSRDLSLKIGNAFAGSGYDGSFLYIDTSSPVDLEKAASFIEIEPKMKLSLELWGNRLRIGGDFKPRDRVRLTVRKGLPPLKGDALAEAWSRAFIIPDVEPSLVFETQGRFISPLGESLMLPITTVNIERLDVGVNRVYDNNVPYVMRSEWPYTVYGLSEEVFKKRYAIESSPNEKTRNSIDLKKILDGKKGVFEVYASRADQWPHVSRIVNVTDLGVSAKVAEKGLLVWVNSISLGEPVPNAQVDVYSDSNQLLESGRTDQEGVLKIDREMPWNPNLRPDLIVVRKGPDGSALFDDTAVLRLENNIWSRGAPEYTGAPYASGEYLGLCYTPRGVFRPGERVPIGAIVRDRALSLKEPFPVQIKVRTSTGREWETRVVELSAMGMASADILLSDASPTGSWRAGVYIPGESEPIAETTFLVEDFAPPRIEVEVSSDVKEIIGEMKGGVSISAQYLFGAPGANLPYELEALFIPREYPHPNWRNYRFDDDRRERTSEPPGIQASGILSADGTISLEHLDVSPPVPAILDLFLRAGVMEDSGRWVYRTLAIPYYPADTLLGILLPQGVVTPGTEVSFGFAAIHTNGAPAEGAKGTYTIYKKRSTVSMHEREGVMRAEQTIRYEALEGYEDLPVSFVDGKAAAKANLPAGGDYLIELTGSNGAMSAAASFYVYDARWNTGDGDAVLPDTLTITLDKPVYKVGEQVRGKVKGSFKGSLLVTVETDSILRHEVVAAEADGGAFAFDVTEEMLPNAWITAQLIRPVLPEEGWRAHRAFGAVPLLLDNTANALAVDIQPSRLYAEKENEISIQLKDHQGKGVEGEVSVLLVDEGVLRLTRFETPDFYRRYTEKRGLTIDMFDVYRDLIRLYTKYPAALVPGGGMAGDASDLRMQQSLSPVRADRFQILTICDRVKTDESGRANLSIRLPQFTGRARLMAVAAAKSAFGAGEARYEITDDIVAELSLPRALAPGDLFDSEIRVFNRTSADIDISMDLSIQGALSLLESGAAHPERSSYQTRTTVRAGSNPLVLPLTMKAGDLAGIADLALHLQYGHGAIRKTSQIAVRPPYPRMTKSTSLSIPAGGAQRLILSDDWFPGTRRAMLAVSSLPQIALTDVAKFLVDYPYYCLEQTVSGGWALIAAPELVAEADAAFASREQIAESLSARIRRIQASQLYNGAFSFWPDSPASDWATAYAVHFLIACETLGYPVPPDTLENAYTYLRQVLAIPPSAESDRLYRAELAVRAYITYIMSIRGDAPHAWMAYLSDNLEEMPAYGRLLLAAAYAKSGQKELARGMLGENLPPIDAQAELQQEQPNWDSPLRTASLYLLAWNEIDPTSAEAAFAAQNLLSELRARAIYTTQEASFSLFTLAAFYAYQEQTGESRMVVKGDRGERLLEQLENKNYNMVLSQDVGFLDIQNTGDAAGYLTLLLDGVPTAIPETRNRGIRASVEYRGASGMTISPNVPLPRGERVTATITLAPLAADIRNVVVALPLAAGFEIENPKLMDAAANEISYEDTNATGARAELRDDRLLLFVDELSKPFKWSCSMRAVTAGRFFLPPVVAEGMYAPGLQSIGASSAVTIVAK